MKYVLASASPRRRELFADISSDFTVDVSSVEEVVPNGLKTEEVPVFLASLKAKDVAKRHPEDLVVGSDTVVVIDGEILGKPRDKKDAETTIRKLSENTHEVITGCCIIKGEKERYFFEKSYVTFYPLTDDEIDEYVSCDEPYDKAGSYGIQGKGKLLVKKIDGDYFNVMGLPVARLKREIDEFLK